MREEWGELAAGITCQAVLTESRSRKEWPYAQYAVAILCGEGGEDFLRCGSAGSCAGASPGADQSSAMRPGLTRSALVT